MEAKIYKFYTLKNKRHGLGEIPPTIKEKEKNGLYKASIEIKDVKIKSGLMNSRELANNTCYTKAFAYLELLDDIYVKNKLLKYYKSLFSKIFLVLLIILIVYTIDDLFLLITIPLTFLFFVSPYFLKECQIGVVINDRVILNWSGTIQNIHYIGVHCLNVGDIFLIKSEIEIINNVDFFEAKVLEEIILYNRVKNELFQTYTLQVGTYCSISRSNTNDQYYIDLISYEVDGLPKRYQNLAVPETSFRIEELKKYHVFTKHGEQVINEAYFEIIEKSGLEWYFSVLSIYFNFICTQIYCLIKNRHQDYNIQPNFNNFKTPQNNNN